MDIELRGITKRFGPVVANADVDLDVRAGEVLGLLGENGAGKSTLMNVLCGLYSPDEGQIVIDGTPVTFDGPRAAIAAGVGMVHQHFMLVPVFTVAENVVLGVEPTGRLDFLDRAAASRQVRQIGEQYGLKVEPDALIEDLPVGIQQRVEIIKVLFRSADVLILDEPTAVLTPQEVEEFFGIVRALRDAGKAIIFITHKLDEILEISDRITVLRGGRVTGQGDPRSLTSQQLAEMMVGRPVSFNVEKGAFRPSNVLLDVRDLTVLRDNDEVAVDRLSLSVHGGEIVGIAGVEGNGQSALIEAITGLRRSAAGAIFFDGEDITRCSVRARHAMGMAHIPEDRLRTGIIGDFTIAENMVLNSYYDDRYASGPSIRWPDVMTRAARYATDFDVRAKSVYAKAFQLSGGNQQKLVAARELTREIKLLIAAQPTRGVDVGSVEFIHKRIAEARDEGDAVLFMSSELDEIVALSDRIVVMFKGRIVAQFDAFKGPVDRNAIGLAMAGSVMEAVI